MAGFDDPREKKISEMTLTEVIDQLQGLEYIELNKPSEYDEACREMQRELEKRQQQLVRDRSLDPKLEDLEQRIADSHAQEAHDLALKQTAELNRLGPSQDLTNRHRQEWEQQSKDFAKERDRYIEEFHDSARIRERLRAEEEQKGLERGHGIMH